MHSGLQTACQLIIFGIYVRQPFYFGLTHMPGDLIVGVLVKFFGIYNTPVGPLMEALVLQVSKSPG